MIKFSNEEMHRYIIPSVIYALAVSYAVFRTQPEKIESEDREVLHCVTKNELQEVIKWFGLVSVDGVLLMEECSVVTVFTETAINGHRLCGWNLDITNC